MRRLGVIWTHSPFGCCGFTSSLPPVSHILIDDFLLLSVFFFFNSTLEVSLDKMQLAFNSNSLQTWIEMRKFKNVNILLCFLRGKCFTTLFNQAHVREFCQYIDSTVFIGYSIVGIFLFCLSVRLFVCGVILVLLKSYPWNLGIYQSNSVIFF